MKVATRLYLAVLPGAAGAFAVAGLAGWGRWAPAALVLVAAVATAASLAVSRRTARYLAGRIESPAHGRGADQQGVHARGDGMRDELDSIHRAITGTRAEGETRLRAAEARAREYAALLRETTAEFGSRLEEVRLPLHILLENRFGDLNENQEEMLAAAQQAAAAAESTLRDVGRMLEMDGGGARSRPVPIRPIDLVAPLLSAARARAVEAGAAFTADVSPGLPHVLADAARAREALARLLEGYLARAAPGGEIRLFAGRLAAGVGIRISDGAAPPRPGFPLVERLLRLQHAHLRVSKDAVEIVLPTILPTQRSG